MELVPVGMPCEGSPCASRAISLTLPVRHCWACLPFIKCRYSSSLPVSLFRTAFSTWLLRGRLVRLRFRVPWGWGRGRCWRVMVAGVLTLMCVPAGSALGGIARARVCCSASSCRDIWMGIWGILRFCCGPIVARMGVGSCACGSLVAQRGTTNFNLGRWCSPAFERRSFGSDGCAGGWYAVGTLNFNRGDDAAGAIIVFPLVARAVAVCGVIVSY